MDVLGAKLSSDGNTLISLRHRLGRATACFYSFEAALCEKSLSLKVRLKEFGRRVQATALYGAGAWTWSQSMYREMYTWENSMLRKIACFSWDPSKEYWKNLQRNSLKIRQYFHTQGNLSLSSKVLDELHRIAGSSFARLSCEAHVDMGSMETNPLERVVDTVQMNTYPLALAS
eukprot:5354670-Karenia_brevis.AAC.1